MFSIIIPLYNKEKYILRAIQSVLEQNYQNWEIIVIDDGSTDNGCELINIIKSEKITVVKQKNAGVSESRNNGIKKAKYPYIAFLDADDYWHEDYLATVEKGILELPEAGIWTSSFAYNRNQLKVESGKFRLDIFFFQEAIYTTKFFTSSVVMKKEFFENQPGFKNYLKRGEDLDVWFRAICYFGKIAHCPDKLVCYERGDETGATKIQPHLKYSILTYILNDDYLSKDSACASQNSPFEQFRNKYVYLNIYKYLSKEENHATIQGILKKIKFNYFSLNLIYRLPFSLLTRFISLKKGRKYFRNYLLFCLKYL